MNSTSPHSVELGSRRIEQAYETSQNVKNTVLNFVRDYDPETSVHLNIGSGASPGFELISLLLSGGVWCSIEPFRGIYNVNKIEALKNRYSDWLLNRCSGTRPVKINISHMPEGILLDANTLNYGMINFSTTSLPPIFDFIFSIAVIEHVRDLPGFLTNNFNSLKPGGFSFHWVDFRDHRNFTAPLEFLTITKNEWNDMYSHLGHYPMGSGVRPSEIDSLFTTSGFRVVGRFATCNIDDDYIKSLRSKLSQDYAHLSHLDLKTGGLLYVLQKQVS